jgi:hypothetical protein
MRKLQSLVSFAMVLGCMGVARAQMASSFDGLPKLDGAWKMVHEEKGKAEMTGATLRIVPETGTNLFLSPDGGYNVVNAPMVLAEAQGDFTLIAKVSAQLVNVYDVGALVVYGDEKHWAKLCFENSPRHEATVVAVVTRERSDDTNSETVASPFVYLAVARKGNEFSFHFSRDGQEWRLVRHFELQIGSKAQIGFAAHTGGKPEFPVQFSEIRFAASAPGNMRQLETPVAQPVK